MKKFRVSVSRIEMKKFRVSVSRISNTKNINADEIRVTRKGQEGPRLSCGTYFIEAENLAAAKRSALRQAKDECYGIKFKIEEAVETDCRQEDCR